ncbi:MAG: hypothetical protein AAFP17_00935 [Pseudomonadota bacterium]
MASVPAEALIFRGALEERRADAVLPGLLALGAGEVSGAFDASEDPGTAEAAAADEPNGGGPDGEGPDVEGIVTPVPALFVQQHGAGPRRAGWRLSNAIVTLVAAANAPGTQPFDPMPGHGGQPRLDLLPLCLTGGWVADQLGLGPLVDWITRDRVPDGVPFPDDDIVAVPLPAPALMLAAALLLLAGRARARRAQAPKGGWRGVVRWRQRAGWPRGTTPPSPAPGR